MNKIVESVKDMFNKNEEPFTAERAWVETTYGSGSYRPLEKRIREKQEHIKELIKGRFGSNNGVGNTVAKAYRCVVDIEDDIKHNINDIFKPFIEGGFIVINLSERIDEIKDENVYLISWKHAFDREKDRTVIFDDDTTTIN